VPNRRQLVRVGATAVFPALAIIRALLPNPVLANGNKVLEWGFTDKRLFTGLYVAFFIAVAVFGLLTPPSEPVRVESAEPLAQSRRSIGGLIRALFGAALGAVLLTPYVVGQIKPNVHLDVQLGGLQSIKLGGTPYVDSITQYAPGMQWLLYTVGKGHDFSYSGFLWAQTVLNTVTLIIVAAAFVWFLGWMRGVLTISALCVVFSPMSYVASMAGWGLLLRWFGVVFISFAAAAAVSSPTVSNKVLRLQFVGVGFLWGIAAVFAQEAVVAGGLSILLCLGFAVAMRIRTRNESIWCGGIAAVGFLASWLVGMVAIVGFANLKAAITLYTRYPAYLSNGVNNNHPLQAFTPGLSIVKIVMVCLPVVLFVTVMFLAAGKIAISEELRLPIRRLIGVVPGAVGLSIGPLFYVTNIHAEGPSILLGALLILLVLDFPKVFAHPGRRGVVRVATSFLVGPFVLLNLMAPSSAPFAKNVWSSRRSMSQWINRTDKSRQAPSYVALRNDSRYSPDDFDHVYGRYVGIDTYDDLFDHDALGELLQRSAVVRSLVANRPVIFFDSRKGENFGMERTPSGSVIFLSDIRNVVPYADPVISLWTTADYRRLLKLIPGSKAICIVTDATPEQSEVVALFVTTFGAVEERRVAVGKDTFRSYC
jgi:hypothetical protein